jgi:hypothetical protein
MQAIVKQGIPYAIDSEPVSPEEDVALHPARVFIDS